MRVAAAALVGFLVGCSGNDASHAFEAPEGFSYSGLPVTPGTTAVIGLGTLQLVDPGTSAKLVALRVEGDHVTDRAGQVLGVNVYSMAESGGIGAITESSLTGINGSNGWKLKQPAGAVVGAQEPVGVAILVRGRSIGSWSSDTLVVDYRMDGRPLAQRISIGAVVCVVADLSQGCEY